ncbi:hypothetical protein QBC39DRAFT_381828 [Podospora conica]|nr:hypothetical protein QBC39DRAFT_381828 [Schizothecium conicum]
MRFFETLAVAALAGSAAASPAVVVRNGVEMRAPKKECLCQADVDEVVSHYKDILTLWKPEYKDWLSEEFYDKSESINNIAGLPFGATIFPSRNAFVGYQSTTPDLIPVKIEKVGPFNCKEISFIWSATFVKAPPPATANGVRGITILNTEKKAGKWLIKSIDVEFNNVNYVKNLGGSVTLPVRPSASSAAPVATVTPV